MDLTYYTTFDLPVPYKNLLIYPITVKDYLYFKTYSQCFLLEKNTIPDIKIISMNELQYLFYATQQNIDDIPYLVLFDRVLSLCLKGDESFKEIGSSIARYKYDETGQPFFLIGKTKYYSQDYMEIRDIICKQNLVDLPDENISKEVRDSFEKARRYKEKLSDSKEITFEDYLVGMSVVTGWTLEYIYSMSARKFLKSVTRLDNYIHYKIYLAASMSGFIEYKDKSFIKHWLSNLDKESEYSDVSVSLDTVAEKISGESAKV